MKNLFIAIVSCFTLSAALADGDRTTRHAEQDPPPISHGSYLHIGLAFPQGSLPPPAGLGIAAANTAPLGLQYSVEVGNQWYFLKSDKVGVGMKFSWMQLGFGFAKPVGFNTNTYTADIRIVKFGPQFSVAMGKNVAVDLSFELNPTFIISGNSEKLINYTQYNYGLLYGPGLRFRYKKYALGGEVAFGTLRSKLNGDITQYISNEEYINFPSSVFYPRVYFGFKF